MTSLFNKTFRRDAEPLPDFTRELRNPKQFSFGEIGHFGLPAEVRVVAHDPLQGLLCVSTAAGSLHLYGSPALSLSWNLRPAHAVKLMVFKIGSPLLIIIDVKNTLTIYDLSLLSRLTYEPKRVAATALRSNATCIEAPSGHSHCFIGYQDGTIDCFDTEHLRLSPFRIRNFWLQQEELLRQSGVPNAPSRAHIPMCTDIKSHPKDMSLLLIAYDGGAVLYNFNTETPQIIYELVIPPGAVGGGPSNEGNVFTERRPTCLCVAWRPDGGIFATGHADGTIAFFDINDGDHPVQVRTIEEIGVNLVKADDLFPGQEQTPAAGDSRSPVFGLQWNSVNAPVAKVAENSISSFFGFSKNATTQETEIPDLTYAQTLKSQAPQGSTLLTILGGSLANDAQGINTFLFPPSQDTSKLGKSASGQHRDSLNAISHAFYRTETAPDDMCLIGDLTSEGLQPASLLVVESPSDALAESVTDFHFSPRSISIFPLQAASQLVPVQNERPPSMEAIGGSALRTANMQVVSSTAFRGLLAVYEASFRPPLLLKNSPKCFPHRFGIAGDHRQVKSLSSLTRTIMLTTHLDLTLRIWDTSPALLSVPQSRLVQETSPKMKQSEQGLLYEGELEYSFPRLLAMVDCRPVFMRTSQLIASMIFRQTPSLLSITHATLSAATSELAVSLSSNEVFFFTTSPRELGDLPIGAPAIMQQASAFAAGKETLAADASEHSEKGKSPFRPKKSVRRSVPTFSPRPSSPEKQSHDHNLLIQGLPLNPSEEQQLAFHANFCISRVQSTGIACLQLSEIGFLAIGWQDGAVSIIDLRGPEILFHQENDGEVPVCMAWSICAMAEDPSLEPRLISAFQSGMIKVVTLSCTLDVWTAQATSPILQVQNIGRPLSLTVLDMHGNEIDASSARLDVCLQEMEQHVTRKRNEARFLLVVAGTEGVSVYDHVIGARLAQRTDLGRVISGKAIQRDANSAFMIFTNEGHRKLLALPSLEDVLHEPLRTYQTRPGFVDIASNGDFLDLKDGEIHFNTCFASAERGQQPTEVQLYDGTRKPPQSALLTSGVTYFTNLVQGNKLNTAGALDALIRGPEHTIQPAVTSYRPEKRQSAVPSASNYSLPSLPALPSLPKGIPSFSRSDSQTSNRRRDPFLDSRRDAVDTRQDLNERGEKLQMLSNTVDQIGTGAQNLVAQAKRLAFEQGVKSKVNSLFS